LPTSNGLLIADSGPLIALAKLSLLALPARIYGRAVMPVSVLQECSAQADLLDAQAIKAAVTDGLLEVLPDVGWPVAIELPRLDVGELSAIAMALENRAQLLIDELRGRHVATQLGIHVVGVCGLLLKAKQNGWVDALTPKLDLLNESGYFISSALRRSVLTAAGE
jgi:predicted nucleic acid-binding protein